ncbi:MAG: hypothetical protein WDW36_004889 [Sanguina aurantia]
MASSPGTASSAEAAPSVEQTVPGAAAGSAAAAAVCPAERLWRGAGSGLAAGAGVCEAPLGAVGVRSTAGPGGREASGGADSSRPAAVAAAGEVLPAV